jgi:hypothetical protein
VSATQTISAIAVASGYAASPVVAAKYTISTAAAHLKPDPEPSPRKPAVVTGAKQNGQPEGWPFLMYK